MSNLSSAIFDGARVFPRQDYAIIGGKKTPGLIGIRGAGTPRKWEERAGFGASNAFLTYMGNRLSQFEIDIWLWDAKNHPDAWADFADVLKISAPGTRAKPVTIDHPLLVWPPLAIRSIVILDVKQPEQDDRGVWVISIPVQQYGAPLPVIVKKADTPDVPSTVAKPMTQAQREGVELQAQLAAIPK